MTAQPGLADNSDRARCVLQHRLGDESRGCIWSRPSRPRAPTDDELSVGRRGQQCRPGRAGQYLVDHADLGMLLGLDRHHVLVILLNPAEIAKQALGVSQRAHRYAQGHVAQRGFLEGEHNCSLPTWGSVRAHGHHARGPVGRPPRTPDDHHPACRVAQPPARAPTPAASQAVRCARGCRQRPYRRSGCVRRAPEQPIRRQGPAGPGQGQAPTRHTAGSAPGPPGRAAGRARSTAIRRAAPGDPGSTRGRPSASYRGTEPPWPPSAPLGLRPAIRRSRPQFRMLSRSSRPPLLSVATANASSAQAPPAALLWSDEVPVTAGRVSSCSSCWSC